MAVNPERMNPPLQPVDDPAVEAAIGRDDPYARIQRQRKLTPAQRRRAERDAARSRVQWDLPEDLIALIETMAAETYRCPPSHLAALLMIAGLRQLGTGELVVSDYLEASRSLKWEKRINLENYPINLGWRKNK
jgi:hypothetical protein